MGFDIVHYNLHKTFSQPHGGGGPGGGPVAVRADLEPFLPSPQVVRDGDAFRLDRDRPKSIGRVRGFAGPFGVFVRSYAFMRAYGPDLKAMSEAAVLNANYLLAGSARRLRARRTTATACTSSSSRRAALKKRARGHGARHRQAADGLRHPSADDLLPARRARRR